MERFRIAQDCACVWVVFHFNGVGNEPRSCFIAHSPQQTSPHPSSFLGHMAMAAAGHACGSLTSCIWLVWTAVCFSFHLLKHFPSEDLYWHSCVGPHAAPTSVPDHKSLWSGPHTPCTTPTSWQCLVQAVRNRSSGMIWLTLRWSYRHFPWELGEYLPFIPFKISP